MCSFAGLYLRQTSKKAHRSSCTSGWAVSLSSAGCTMRRWDNTRRGDAKKKMERGAQIALARAVLGYRNDCESVDVACEMSETSGQCE